jgi:excisionase family DNA binding protein
MQTKTVLPRYLLLPEAAELARASVSSVRYWIQCGKLKAHRPGRRVLIAADDLERFLAGTHAA